MFTPGLRAREGRAYCSNKEWANARYPDNNITDMVPQLLNNSTRQYSNLILHASCNDISNLHDKNRNSQQVLAEQSSINTIAAAAEKALTDFLSLESVLIMERPPQADNISELSEHTNNTLNQTEGQIVPIMM